MKTIMEEVVLLRKQITEGTADQALFRMALLMERMASRLAALEDKDHG